MSTVDAAGVRRRSENRGFYVVLALVALAAFAVRVGYVLIDHRARVLAPRPGPLPGGDSFFYHASANLLARGHAFVSPYVAHTPSADHPPLYTVFLAATSVLGMRSVLAHLLWSCVLGAGTVVVVGLVGRAVAGSRAGIIAASIAAIYPNMWAPDGGLQAETLAMFLIAVAVLFAYRYYFTGRTSACVAVGIVVALAALTRGELILLVPFLVLPLVVTARGVSRRGRWVHLASAVLATAIVIAPWTAYNMTRFTHPVVLSAQAGPLLSSANCDSTYYGAFAGYFDIRCTVAAEQRAHLSPKADGSTVDLVNRREAWRYISGHLSRVPTVEATRLLRLVGLYHPKSYVYQDALFEPRPLRLSWAALWSFYVLALLSVAGVFVMRRRRREIPRFPLLAPIGVTVVTVLLAYANTRFRTTAEPSLAILSAVTLDAVAGAITGRRRPRTTAANTTMRSPGVDHGDAATA